MRVYASAFAFSSACALISLNVLYLLVGVEILSPEFAPFEHSPLHVRHITFRPLFASTQHLMRVSLLGGAACAMYVKQESCMFEQYYAGKCRCVLSVCADALSSYRISTPPALCEFDWPLYLFDLVLPCRTNVLLLNNSVVSENVANKSVSLSFGVVCRPCLPPFHFLNILFSLSGIRCLVIQLSRKTCLLSSVLCLLSVVDVLGSGSNEFVLSLFITPRVSIETT